MLTTAEVQTHAADPTLAAALAAGDDVSAAARLSQLLVEVSPVPINVLGAWAAQTGVRANVQTAADTPAHPLRSIALTAIDLMQGSMSQTFDTVIYAGLLDAMQAGGLMTQGDRDALTALATKPRQITANEVSAAARNEDGSAKWQ
jgi:hypothetical protein